MVDNQRWARQARWFTQALLISGALNIGLLATFFYLLLRQDPTSPENLQQAVSHPRQVTASVDQLSNAQVLSHFATLTFDQLVGKLENAQLVEDGYTQRDLSLACLVHRYQFHLQKALGTLPAQQRLIRWPKGGNQLEEMLVFPGLSDEHYRAIIHYATTERWPLTTKGLFLQLKGPGRQKERTLLEAFYLTPEFLEVEALLSQAGVPLSKERLLTLLLEGPWQKLETFYQSQRAAQDLSSSRRQQFLLDYAVKGSKTAAYLLLQTDGAFVAKKGDDGQIAALLQLLTEKTPEAQQFAMELLASPRSDAVWKLAAGRLYAFAGESPTDPNDLQRAKERFLSKRREREDLVVPLAVSTKEPSSKPTAKTTHGEKSQGEPLTSLRTPVEGSSRGSRTERIYIVQANDNLWNIAHKYGVDVATLRSYNALDSDNLRIGQVLKIPS